MKDSAVTPVVGVMLLLSITIIAVAVFSAFAGGVVKTTEKSPSAEISVTSSGNSENFKLVFEHKGGDVLSTSDIKVTTLIKDSVNPVENSFTLSELGENTWTAGKILTASDTQKYLGTEDLNLYISKSTPLEIKMYHIPTSTIIYQSAILLEEK